MLEISHTTCAAQMESILLVCGDSVFYIFLLALFLLLLFLFLRLVHVRVDVDLALFFLLLFLSLRLLHVCVDVDVHIDIDFYPFLPSGIRIRTRSPQLGLSAELEAAFLLLLHAHLVVVPA